MLKLRDKNTQQELEASQMRNWCARQMEDLSKIFNYSSSA